MSIFSRFAMSTALIAAPLFFSSCSSEKDDPQPIEPKELTGTATEYLISVAPTGRVHAVYMEFKDQDNKMHKVALNPASPGSGRDQASQILSTDNFLREQSIVRSNEYNQLVLMRDNKDFSINIDVDAEDREAAGVRSINVAVPSNTLLMLEYVSENDVITLTDPKNRDILSDEVSRVISVVHGDRYKVILDQ